MNSPGTLNKTKLKIFYTFGTLNKKTEPDISKNIFTSLPEKRNL